MAEPSIAAPAQAARRVVSVRDLVVDFVQDTGATRALAGLNLDLHAGRVLGVVGESGCGKRSAGNLGALRHRPPQCIARDGATAAGGRAC
jgi:ABC-type dipeptide/oligopeptide/nickel transport system ATPase component